MADLHTYKKLPSDPCLTQEQITAYIDGNLSVAEQHACERHMVDCELCEDAVEGLALVKDRSVLASPIRTSETPAEGKVIPLHQPRRIAFAAAAVLVLILGCTFLFKMMSDGDAASEDILASNQEVRSDSTIGDVKSQTLSETSESSPSETQLKNESEGERSLQSPADEPGIAEKKPTYFAEEAYSPEAEQPMVAADDEVTIVYDSRQEDVVLKSGNEKDGDADNYEKKEDAQGTSGKDKSASETEEKKNLFDRAKSGIAAGGAKRSESKQNDAFVTQSRDAAVPTAPQTLSGNDGTVVNGAVTPTLTNTNVVSQTSLDSVNLAVGYGGIADSVAPGADQLELSYQNGVTLLNAGQTSNAIVMFDKVLVNKNHSRYEDAEFQKAKALIKANRKPEAKTLLQSIEAKKGKHAAEATELLKTIQ
jgi:hypothetical protein